MADTARPPERTGLGPGVRRRAGHLAAKGRPDFGRARPLSTVEPAVSGVPSGLPRQLLRFAAIGVVSTVAYLVLFSVLRHGLTAQAANLLALLATAIANTAANRRLTFGITGRRHAARHQAQGLFVFAFGLGLTSGSLLALHAVTATPARAAELTVLVLANLASTVLRFVLLRLWLFHRRPASA